MKKFCFFISVFIVTAGSVCAQSNTNSISQIDNTVNALARNIHEKLVEEQATKVAVSQQFPFRESIPPFVSYWVNQLTGELANIPNKPYILLPDGLEADIRISGEIVETAGIVRVYTRLIRQENRAIVASFQSDFEQNAAISALLASDRSGSAYVPLDIYEPDSWDNPVLFEIAPIEDITEMVRTISENEDEDFFLLLPNNNGRLVMETTGDIDTYMEFYDADTRRVLAEDDDSGQSYNAKITYNVDTGKRYIAKVQGYGGEAGQYAFRAYFRPQREADNSWENPIRYELGIDQNATEVYRSIFEDDEDFFILVPSGNGKLVMETTGDTDTYMELYDADNRQTLAEDDDSGQGYNARIIYNFDAGKRYIVKVRGYGNETVGIYAFRAYIRPQREGESSWENPVRYELGTNQNATVVNRVLIYDDDEDFFILVPSRNGIIMMETTGDTDTLMEFYDADTNQLLAEDDDSGQDYNAQISYSVEARKRYIVKIWSYGDNSGSYGFKAYLRR